MNLAGAFVASVLYVSLRSFQQLNVVREKLSWIMPTSLAMSATDAFIIVAIAKAGWNFWLVLTIGLGGGIGSILAILLHKFIHKKPR